jgi:hypothetical protein
LQSIPFFIESFAPLCCIGRMHRLGRGDWIWGCSRMLRHLRERKERQRYRETERRRQRQTDRGKRPRQTDTERKALHQFTRTKRYSILSPKSTHEPN